MAIGLILRVVWRWSFVLLALVYECERMDELETLMMLRAAFWTILRD